MKVLQKRILIFVIGSILISATVVRDGVDKNLIAQRLRNGMIFAVCVTEQCIQMP